MTHEQVASVTLVSPEEHQAQGTIWEYTVDIGQIADLRRGIERMCGRPERSTIGRDMPIREGVYEGAYGGEAIVVDYSRDPELLDQTTAAVLQQATNPATGRVDKGEVLSATFDAVSRRMRYDSRAVEDIFHGELGGKDGAKMSLSYYIRAGVGECRHQALYAGAVLESLKDKGVITGTVSIDRNMVRRGPDGKYDGHAWIRYTSSGGAVYIMDIAQQRLDSLDNLMHDHAVQPSSTWDYAREEDRWRLSDTMALQHVYDVAQNTNNAGVIDRLPWDN